VRLCLQVTTVNRALVSLSRFCQWLSEQGIIVANPVEGIKPIQLTTFAPHWLTRLQQAALMRAVQASQNLRDLAIVGLMLHVGLRVSEVCQLRRQDLILQMRSGQVTVRYGKGNKHRIVPLNITIRRILMNYLAILSDEPDFLFSSRFRRTATGELCQSHLSSRGVQHLVKRYAERAKLDRVSPHTLRHSFCKNLIDAGVSLDKVALLAGHSSLDVTRRYTTPSIEDLQESVEHLAWE
jgi:site-specific recombinase XerD